MSDIPKVSVQDMRSVYPSLYVAIANMIVGDPYIAELQSNGEFDFDFLPYSGINAKYVVPPVSTTPHTKPRLNLVRTSSNIKGINSAQKEWLVGYNVIVQGLHLRSTVVDQLAGQLDNLLSDTTFIQEVCGQITSSATQFNYDSVTQTVTATLSITVRVTTSRYK